MKVNLSVKVVLRNKKGKIIKTINRKANSFVQQLIDILRCQMSQISAYSKDTSGSTMSLIPSPYALDVIEIAGNTAFGILVGTGNTTVTITDFALVTKILDGSTVGKLNHGSVSVGTVVVVGATAKFTISRTFTNNSVADIDVKEVGLVYARDVSGSTYYFMIERSLLAFTISAGTSGTVTYTISVTV